MLGERREPSNTGQRWPRVCGFGHVHVGKGKFKKEIKLGFCYFPEFSKY